MAFKKNNSNRYTSSERKSYRAGFLAGLFSIKKKRKVKKIVFPKNATKFQRHNILMRDDPNYLIAHRAAMRASSDIEDNSKRAEAIERYRNSYYASIKNNTDYGKYLKSKFND